MTFAVSDQTNTRTQESDYESYDLDNESFSIAMPHVPERLNSLFERHQQLYDSIETRIEHSPFLVSQKDEFHVKGLLSTTQKIKITSTYGPLYDLDPLHDRSEHSPDQGVIISIMTPKEEEWLIYQETNEQDILLLHDRIIDSVSGTTTESLSDIVKAFSQDQNSSTLKHLLYLRSENYTESRASTHLEAVHRARLFPPEVARLEDLELEA